MFKKSFEYFFIKNIQMTKFNLQKYFNFFRYNIVSYAYFCSGIFQKNILFFFSSYKFFFANQKIICNFFIAVTKHSRYLFLRIINIFQKTTLFIDNIFTSSIVFFSKIFYNNKVNKINKINCYKRKRFSFAVKRYISRISKVKYKKSLKDKKAAYSLFSTLKSDKVNKISFIKYLSKSRINKIKSKIFIIYTIPFFTSRTYFRQKFLSKKKRNTIKFQSKFQSKFNQRRIRTLYAIRARKGYKVIQPESFYFKLYATNYQESKPNTNKFNQLKLLLGLITNTQFSFYFINAISLTRFAFDKEYYRRKNKKIQQFLIKNSFNQKKGKRCSQRFLRNIEQEIR